MGDNADVKRERKDYIVTEININARYTTRKTESPTVSINNIFCVSGEKITQPCLLIIALYSILGER